MGEEVFAYGWWAQIKGKGAGGGISHLALKRSSLLPEQRSLSLWFCVCNRLSVQGSRNDGSYHRTILDDLETTEIVEKCSPIFAIQVESVEEVEYKKVNLSGDRY